MKKRALLSVYDKGGIVELARALAAGGWEILSTGGTAAYLEGNGIVVTGVSSVTGFPECLDGRVKTLHPAIHAGLLARRDNAAHLRALDELGFGEIALVAVNLYPFLDKVREGGLPLEAMVEFIDIGGPAMLRSAAKNFDAVIALCDPADYGAVIAALEEGELPLQTRRGLAAKVFNLTAAYDAAVSRYLLGPAPVPEDAPPFLSASYRKAARFSPLRYGENAHQKAAFYLNAGQEGAMGAMEQLSGKAMSYNNIRDIDFAWKAVSSFSGEQAWKEAPVAAVAVKHIGPCGIALGKTPLEAYLKAYACDTVSLFGGIVALNAPVDKDCAQKLAEVFLEIIVAPDFTPDALAVLQRKKGLRVIKTPRAPREPYEIAGVDGGILVQERDRTLDGRWDMVTKRRPEPEDIADMRFAMRAVCWARSNAVVIARNLATAGIGSGEPNRLSAAALALDRAAHYSSNARVLASDGFFPFPDTVRVAAQAGIKAIIQPGGSINDQEVIEACDKLGIAMVFTGTRHFRH
jgi:phosphoribosylaminoimidazolecarboxamide formyltransferase/IMP cyclohydrolase